MAEKTEAEEKEKLDGAEGAEDAETAVQGEAEQQGEAERQGEDEEAQEEVKQLPMWQHIILVLLFLLGMAAVVTVIDFVIDLFSELIQRIF